MKFRVIGYGKFLNREAGTVSLDVVECLPWRCKLQLFEQYTTVCSVARSWILPNM